MAELGSHPGTPSATAYDQATYSWAQHATMGATGGTATSISIYCRNNTASPGTISLAIYSDNGSNSPDTRLALSDDISMAAGDGYAWRSANIAASLSPSTKYWLAYHNHANGVPCGVNYATGSSGDSVYIANSTPSDDLPSTWPADTEFTAVFDLYLTYTETPTGQFARPSSDVTDGGWTNQAGSATDLFESINETVALLSDADFIKSGTTPTDDACTVGLSPITTPQAGTVTLRVRAAWL